MPLDPSIYNQPRVNLGAGLSSLLDEQRKRELDRINQANAQAAMAQQQQLGALQFGNAQRQQEAFDTTAQQEAQKRAQIEQILPTLPPHQQQWIRMGVPVEKVLVPEKVADKTPWYVQRDEQGQIVGINPIYQQLEQLKAKSGAVRMPMTPVAYKDNEGQAIWGTINEAKGRPVVSYDPAIQGAVAGAKAFGKSRAEDQGRAIGDMDRVISNSNEAIRLGDELLKHPGFKQAVGASSLLGVQHLPGTNARNFMNRLDQIKGGAFLEAFNTLKGGGQITEVEGKKATDAIARMDNATSEDEFVAAVRDYQNVIRTAVGNIKRKAGQSQQVSDEWSDL